MKPGARSPLAIWIALVALTLISVAIAEGALLRSFSFVAITFIAAAKSRMIILDYMEARNTPGRWRFLYTSWTYAVTAVIVAGHAAALYALP